VNPTEAVQIHLDVQARQSIAMHFGTFQLADEGIDDPIHELRAALRAKCIPEPRFVVPAFGETITVHPVKPAPPKL
jgi:N-acyl-phosphatidylethanolamine-hydrolysing phospholipase D